MSSETERWPQGAAVTTGSRWRVKENPGIKIKPGTTALLVGASMMENEITLWINPAIGWCGTYQELQAEWESVPDTTRLTF